MYEKKDFFDIAVMYGALPPFYDEHFNEEYLCSTNEKRMKRLRFWLSLDEWTIKEAVFLLIDISPEELYWHNGSFESCWSFSGNFDIEPELDSRGLPIPQDFQDGMEIYYTNQQLSLISQLDAIVKDYFKLFKKWSLGSPKEWVQRALEKKLFIPWLDWAVNEGIYKPESKQEVDMQLGDRELESMLKIIHALAKNGYKYPQRGALKEMIEDFQRNNNGVSEKTLKKYLDEATKL